MQNLVNEITEHFMTSTMGARALSNFPKEQMTITLKHHEYYGVGILNTNNVDVNESFANVKLENKTFNMAGEEISFLVLSSSLYEHRQGFAHLCAEFSRLGDNDFNRELITTEPIKWWDKWRALLGNVSSEKQPYSVIGELLLYKKELESKHKNVTWEGPKKKNHDIEGEEYHLEVKTTISQFKNHVTISNQFQLDANKDLFLVLLKLQESSDGVSINMLVDDLINLGIDSDALEMKLGSLQMPYGSNVREQRYRILEGRKYKVDDNFPIINAKSFVGGKIPKHIQKIVYTVDLSSFEYDTMNVDL